jgi:hypothetical protein
VQPSRVIKNWVLFTGTLLAIVLILAASAIGTFLYWASYRRIEAVNSIATVSKVAGISFPTGSKVLDGEVLIGSMSKLLVARISLPQKELAQFLLQPEFHNVEFSKSDGTLHDSNGYDLMTKRGWNLRKSRNYLEADYLSIPEKESQLAVMIDRDDPVVATVYIQYSR